MGRRSQIAPSLSELMRSSRYVIGACGLVLLIVAAAGCDSSHDASGKDSPAAGAADIVAAPSSGETPGAGASRMQTERVTTGPSDADSLPAIRYACENGLAVEARYGSSGEDGVKLSIGGKDYRLASVMAGSGSKYESPEGLAPGKSLVWWTKGESAMLIEPPKGGQSGENEQILRCDQVP